MHKKKQHYKVYKSADRHLLKRFLKFFHLRVSENNYSEMMKSPCQHWVGTCLPKSECDILNEDNNCMCVIFISFHEIRGSLSASFRTKPFVLINFCPNICLMIIFSSAEGNNIEILFDSMYLYLLYYRFISFLSQLLISF